MLVRNAKNTAELEAKRLLALKLLEIESSNEEILNKKTSEYRNPYKAPDVPPQYKDQTEIAKDFLGNELRLIQLLTTFGFNNQIATTVVKNVSSSGDGNAKILKLLQSSGNLKRKFESYDKSLLSAEFVSNVIERFLATYEKTLGGSEIDALSMMLAETYTAKNIFPSRDNIERLRGVFLRMKEKKLISDEDIKKSMESLNKYLEILPMIESYLNNPNEVIKKEKTKEIQALLQQGNIPVASNFDSYISILSNFLANAEQGMQVKREDVYNEMNKMNSELGMILTPDSTLLINAIKGTLKLPPNADINVVLDTAQNALLTKEQEIEKKNIENNELIKENTLQHIKNGDFLNDITVNAQLTRAVYDDKKLSTSEIGARNLIINNYKNYFNEEVSKGRIDYDVIYDEIVKDLDDAYKNKTKYPLRVENKINTGSMAKKSKVTFRNIDTDEQKEEIDTEIRLENEFNPFAVTQSENALDTLIMGKESGDMYLDIEPKLVKANMSQELLNLLEKISNLDLNEKRKLKVIFFENDVFPLNDLESKIIYDVKNNYIGQSLKRINEYNQVIDSMIGSRKRLEYIDLPQFNEKQTFFPNSVDTNDYKKFKKLIDDYNDETLKILGNEYNNNNKILKNNQLSTKNLYNKMVDENYQVGTLENKYKNRMGVDFKGLGFAHRKIKVGKGLEYEEEPKYIQFGKYLLNKTHLYNDSKLTLKFPSGGAIPSLKPIDISEDFKEFLIDLIENNEMSNALYKSIPKDEKLYFQKMCKGAKIMHKLGLKKIEDDSDSKDLARYKLLFGELTAGNNNKQMINELKGLVLKFINNGRMKKNEGQQLLYELSEL
jgi:hypothetical protein